MAFPRHTVLLLRIMQTKNLETKSDKEVALDVHISEVTEALAGRCLNDLILGAGTIFPHNTDEQSDTRNAK